jgi:hypothetical protein
MIVTVKDCPGLAALYLTVKAPAEDPELTNEVST